MLEIEFKAALTAQQAKELPEKLLTLGYSGQRAVWEQDVYFNAPDRDFRKTDEALRLRTVRTLPDGAEQTFITYKGAKLDEASSSRRELETGVASFGTMQALLLALGYRAVFSVRKTRRSVACGAKTVCLDCVDGLGDFIELETVLPDGTDYETAAEALLTLLDTLQIPRSALTRKSYLELLMASATV